MFANTPQINPVDVTNMEAVKSRVGVCVWSWPPSQKKKKIIAGGGSEITVVCDSDKDPPAVMENAGTLKHGSSQPV